MAWLLRYLYLYLALFQLAGVALVWLTARDLRRVILAAGAVGALVESVSEIWYTASYWHPPTLLPWPTIEDMMYGFGVTALAACAVAYWIPLPPWRRGFRTYSAPDPQRDYRALLPVLLICFFALMQLGHIAGAPSIWVAIVVFAVAGGYGVAIRPGLIWIGLVGGLIMGAIATIGYGIGLNFLVDGHAYLDQILVQRGTGLDIRVLGQVPLDEIVWNFTRGWCVAILYPFLTGRSLERHPPRRGSIRTTL